MLKPAANGDRAGHTVDSECMAELRQVKAMIEKLSMQETLDSRSRTQESMIAKLGEQIEELTQRLAKPEKG